jgi:hypothetical protein
MNIPVKLLELEILRFIIFLKKYNKRKRFNKIHPKDIEVLEIINVSEDRIMAKYKNKNVPNMTYFMSISVNSAKPI